ncbi:MAG: tail fiber protein [Acidovorax sp.]|uniref:phage tail protein n=1 Tax=Acidovorax sp. TaxID=1872122 RepID=UPI0025B9DCD6|nr:tail fiber protein [Acidovorax sp.]MCE1191426.1 tail fiber protein [Acidovorax sp.]
MDPFIGEIRAFAFGMIPKGWAVCNGSLLAIAQNQPLFSLLGTRYGGNGQTTFALPDLRGRTPVGYGQTQSGGLPLGTNGGSETVALTTAQVPSHSHALRGTTGLATTNNPANGVLAQTANAASAAYAAPGSATLAAAAVASSGAGLAHENMQPSLVVNWCIAINGIFPSRN